MTGPLKKVNVSLTRAQLNLILDALHSVLDDGDSGVWNESQRELAEDTTYDLKQASQR
jgi:hypothetical protein